MNDQQTTVADLRKLVGSFAERRNWAKFHSPKNLATSISIEAAELCEHFQWITEEESRALIPSVSDQSPIAEELADVVCYALSLANVLQIDLARSIELKMLRNAVKYPEPS